MTTIAVNEGGPTTATAFTANGTSGAGFIHLTSQGVSVSAPSGIRLYSNSGVQLSWTKSDGFLRTLSDAGINASRTWTLPNLSDGLTSTTNTITFQNKTITGGSTGNDVSANKLRGVTVSASAPSNKNVLKYNSGATQWEPSTPFDSDLQLFNIPASFITTSGSYAAALPTTGGNGTIYFPGSTAVTLSSFKIIWNGDVSAVSGGVRVYDLTNAQQICEILTSTAGGTPTTNKIVSTSTFTNIPASEAIFQVQGKRTAGGALENFNLTNVTLRYN